MCTDALAAWISDHSGVWRVETGTGTVLYSVSEVAGRCTVVGGKLKPPLRYATLYYRSTLPSVRRPTRLRRPAPRALPRATGGTLHAAAARRSRCSRSSATPTPRSPVPTDSRPMNPHPQIDQRRVRAQRAVEGTHAAQHALDAGANARSQRAL